MSQLSMVQKKIKAFFKNPARAIVLAYLVTIFIGAFFLSLPISRASGAWYDFGNSLFTATSSVSVSGMAMSDVAVSFSLFGQIVILLLIQIGGIGCMGSAMLLLVAFRRRITLSERLVLEESMESPERVDVLKTFKQLLVYVLVAELIGALILMASFIPYYGGGKGFFYSVFTSVSAFCNAGVDMAGLSAHADNFWVLGAVMALVTFGGFGFIVVRDILLRIFKKKRLSLHVKIVLVVSAVLIVVGTAAFMGLEWNNAYSGRSGGERFLSALFQSVSLRTAGFSTVEQSLLTPASTALSTSLMFIGASPVSTGGGIKTTTFLMLLVIIGNFMRGRTSITFCKKSIPDAVAKKTLAVFFVAVATVVLSTFLVLAFEGGRFTFGDALYDAVAAFTTTGLSTGVAAAGGGGTKFVLALAMLVGRVGVMSIGTAFLKSGKGNGSVRYTEAKIII